MLIFFTVPHFTNAALLFLTMFIQKAVDGVTPAEGDTFLEDPHNKSSVRIRTIDLRCYLSVIIR